MRLVLAATLSAGAVAAGCGGGSDRLSKDQYVKKFKLAGRIAALKAPKEVEEPQDRFVGALREQATELDQAVAAYRSGNKKPLETIESRGGPSKDVAEREEKALEEFKEKGYRVATLD